MCYLYEIMVNDHFVNFNTKKDLKSDNFSWYYLC